MTVPLVIVQSSPTIQTAFDLARAARQRGYAVQDISFHRDDPQRPEIFGHWPIFIFGSVALMKRWVAQYPELNTWIWYDHKRLGPEAWAEHLGSRFLNAAGRVMSIADFTCNHDYAAHVWHVRPLLNDKNPPGKLYSQDDLKAVDLPGDRLMWIAPPVPILDEVRIWFIGGKAVAASQYRENGKLVRRIGTAKTLSALEEAALLGNAFLPHPHCVMDVANTPDGEWKVVEYNPIHGAGWYAVDPGIILDAFVGFFNAEPAPHT